MTERKLLNDRGDYLDLHTIGSDASREAEAALFNTQEAEIAATIVRVLGCEAKDVTREATFESLGADSLDHVELVMEFEDEFHIEISDAEAEGVKTVGDAFRVIATATAHEADATIRPVR